MAFSFLMMLIGFLFSFYNKYKHENRIIIIWINLTSYFILLVNNIVLMKTSVYAPVVW